MNALASECSSGCESGWTLYLEHSLINQNASSHRDRGTRHIGRRESERFYEEHKDKRAKDEDSDEEDLSMVSDASSWPPHYSHDEAYFNEQENNGCFYSPSKAVKNVAKSGTITKRQKVKEIQHCEDQHLPSLLHDTASSHVFDFSTNKVDATNRQTSTENMLDYSQGFSATYIERRPPFQEHFGFLQPSLSETELHENKWYGGKGIGMRER